MVGEYREGNGGDAETGGDSERVGRGVEILEGLQIMLGRQSRGQTEEICGETGGIWKGFGLEEIRRVETK